MTTLGSILRLASATGWGLLVFAILVFDGFDPILLPFLGLFTLSLIPHRRLLHPRILFGIVLALSLLPFVRMIYAILTTKWVNAAPTEVTFWSIITLVMFTWFAMMLPVSLVASFLGERKARHCESDPAA
jgi:hypothetical protein